MSFQSGDAGEWQCPTCEKIFAIYFTDWPDMDKENSIVEQTDNLPPKAANG